MEININDEGFFYQETAEIIVEQVLSCFQNNVKNFEDFYQWEYNVPISSEEEDHHHFNFYFRIVRADTKDEDFQYAFFGSAGRDFCDEPSIDLNVLIPKGKHQNKVKIDRNELFDVIAHELHHLAQNNDNNTYRNDKLYSGKMAYLLDPCEIEAFHIGIRARIFLTGRTFEDIGLEYMDMIWPEGSQEDKNTVINEWKNTDFPVFNQNIKQ